MLWRACLLAAGLGMSGQAGPIFLQIEGIPGESQTEHHAGWIEVEAFAGGIASGRGGVVPGQPTPRTSATAEVTFLKFTDKSSPRLAQALCRGEVFPKARFEELPAGRQFDFFLLREAD